MTIIINKFIDKSIVQDNFDTLDPLQKLIGNKFVMSGENDGFQGDINIDLSVSNPHQTWVWDVNWSPEEEHNGGLFPGKKQEISMLYVGEGTLKEATRDELEQWFKTNLSFNRGFSNHNITIPIPGLDVDPEKFSNSSIDVESFYNYEFYNYELISNGLNSNLLPGYLLFDYAEAASGYNSIKSEFIRSYDGNFIDFGAQKVAMDVQDNNDSNLYLFNRKDNAGGFGKELKTVDNNYFKMFTDSLLDESSGLDLSAFETKNSNVFVHYDYSKTNLDYLPHWVRVKVPKLIDIDINLPFGLPPYVISSFDTTKIDEALINHRLIKFIYSYMKNTTPGRKQFYCEKGDETSLKALKTWDLTDWWKSDPFDSLEEGEDETFLLNEEDINLMGPSAILERRLRKVIALGMIRETTRQNLHNFEDCIIKNKEKAKSIIGYKVEKFLSDPEAANRTPIQTFYFESNGGSEIDFIDTQVSFDTKYYYSISALVAVIGSTYSYRNLRVRTRADARDVATFDFITMPSLKIIEIPLENVETRVIEPPPLRPNVVRVANEKFVKNKIKFFIHESFGNVYDEHGLEKYIRILSKDDSYYNKLVDSHQRKDERFFYSSRASTGHYEVFRIEEKPESYSDFENGYIGTIENNFNSSIDAYSSAEYVDFIEHEKKYYYLFRALTPHSRSSNPSFVFEAYLIQDADEVKLILDAYHLEESLPKTDNHATMRRFLQLIPNSQHTVVNSENNPTADENSLQLGLSNLENSLWKYSDYSKNFIKLRLTSKTSGKKIDLNLIFKVKSEATQN
jgi:hypothetical protein